VTDLPTVATVAGVSISGGHQPPDLRGPALAGSATWASDGMPITTVTEAAPHKVVRGGLVRGLTARKLA
jgi:hypothetical protein